MNHIFTRFALTLSLILTSQLAFAQTFTDTLDVPVDSCTALTISMSLGSKDSRTNGQVSDLQAYLQSAGYLASDPTGYFGALTKKAVQAFQAANGITSNGVAGPYTRGKIKDLSCGTTTTTIQTGNTSTSLPVINIRTNSSSIAEGSTVSAPNGNLSLSWGAVGATSCTLNTVPIPVSGSQNLTNLTSAPYIYTCTNSAGSKSLRFNVNVPVTNVNVSGSLINFVAGSQTDCNNSIVRRFGSAVATCSIGGGCSVIGTIPSATNPTGNPSLWGACVSSSIAPVAVPAIAIYTNGSPVADGSTVSAPNGNLSLVWGGTGATSCTLNGVSVPVSGSQTFTNLTSASYTYTCVNSTGLKSLTFSTSVVAAGVPVASVSVTPGQLDVNASFTISWSGTFSPTGYIVKVDDTIAQSNTTATSFTGTPASLSLTPGQHTVWVKACTSAGCSAWAQQIFVVTSTTVAWQIPHDTTLTLSKTSVDINSPLTISWSSVNSPATADMTYFLKINDITYPQGTATAWTGTPASLGFTPKGYTIYSEACNAKGCDWSSMHDFLVTSTTQASQAPYPVTLTMPSQTTLDAPFTVSWSAASSPATVPVNYYVRIDNATLDQGTNKSWTGTATSLGLSSGRHMFSVQACNNAGCNWTAQQFLDVAAPVVTPAPAPTPAPSAYMTLNPANPTINTSFTATWVGSNSPTKYWLKIDGVEKDLGTVTTWTGTPAALGLSAGTHTFYVKACNGTSGTNCGNWDGAYYLTVGAVLGVSTSCTDLPYNMFRGYESQSVTALQTFLKSRGLLTDNATGFYGDQTVEAVKAYQGSHNLPQTGMAYDFTRLAIRAETCQ